MILKEDFIVVHELYKKGHSIREISKMLKMNRRTVSSALAKPEYKKATRGYKKPLKLDQYKDYIKEFINKSQDRVPAEVILTDIKQMGYEGKLRLLQDYLSQLYKTRIVEKDPVVRFETEPGKQTQVDWTTIRHGKNPIYAFVATLGYSRCSFVYFVNNMESDTLITCHEKSFIYFKGVTKTILYDNMKAVVIERDKYGKGKHQYNPKLLDLSKLCGFEIKLCRPYRAKTKGKVERFNSYLKGNFYKPLCIKLQDTGLEITCELLNNRIGNWLHKANNRIHGTTKEKPLERLKIEQLSLIPYGVNSVNTETQDTVKTNSNIIVNQQSVRQKMENASDNLNTTTNKRMLDLPQTVVQPTNLQSYDQLLGARL